MTVTAARIRHRAASSGQGRNVLDYIASEERRATRETKEVTLPLSHYHHARLVYLHQMDESEWQQMMTLLNLMKPGIVRSSPSSRKDGDT